MEGSKRGTNSFLIRSATVMPKVLRYSVTLLISSRGFSPGLAPGMEIAALLSPSSRTATMFLSCSSQRRSHASSLRDRDLT